MRVSDVLSFYVPTLTLADETAGVPRVLPDLEALAGDLDNVSHRNARYFNICVVFVIVIFLAGLVIAYSSRHAPTYIAALLGATGISLLGAVAQMMQLWREKVRADMLLVLVRRLPPEDVQTVITVLLRSLSARPDTRSRRPSPPARRRAPRTSPRGTGRSPV